MARDPEDPRSRSRSPAPASDRLPDIPKDKTKSKTKSSKSSGFRWKEKKDADTDDRHDGDIRTQSRYRERSSSRERKRKRRTDENVVSDVTPTVQPDLDDDIAAKFGPGAAVVRTQNTSTSTSGTPQTASATAPKKPKTSAKSSIPTGPMIVVKVNDRLGTTSKVPCLASDNIGDFKKLLAMRIGRKPHEIMLKRQGERPFKDMLSLQDYGVSDGVQIDLELDTGD